MVDRLRGEEFEETNWELRIALTVTGIAGIVVAYSFIYQWALWFFVDEEISIFQAAQVVVEALTTAGFGGDTDLWRQHDALALLVIAMNLSGVLLVFLAIPLFAVPMFRQALDQAPPMETDMTDHIIICGHSAIDDVLREELERAGKPYLFVENDPEEVLHLIEEGENAIYGNAERTATLRNANAEDAIALVADLDDETNPTVILSANRVNPDLNIVSVVNTREAVAHHRFAGADHVVVSKESLGESLAMRAMETVSERFHDAVQIQNGPEFQEYLIPEGSPLIGMRIDEVGDMVEEDIWIIGGWFGPKFLISPPPDTKVLENSILLVSGSTKAMDELDVRPLPHHHGHPSRVIVCGYGDVGRAAVKTLQREGIDTTVVDRRDIPQADVVGDITKRGTLSAANLDEARSIILAVDDDPTSIYSSIFINNLVPDIEIIARANDPENVWKLYHAGADYVLSLPAITGEILASTLIEEEEILTPHDEFEFERRQVDALAGSTLAETDIRNKTGCTVVAVERGDDLHTDLGPGFEFQTGDFVVVAGSHDAIKRFDDLLK